MNSRFVGAFSFLFLGTTWAVAQGPLPPINSPPNMAMPTSPQPLPANPVPVASPAPAPGTTAPAPYMGPVTTAPTPYSTQPYGTQTYMPPAPQANASSQPSYFSEPVADTSHVYTSFDYLLWRIRHAGIPATTQAIPTGVLAVNITDQFVTTPNGVPSPGGTTVFGYAPLFIQTNSSVGGGNSVDLGEQSGGRLTAGFWLDAEQDLGFETSFFFLGKKSSNFGATSANQTNQFLLNTGFTQNIFLLVPSLPGSLGAQNPPTQTLLNSFPVLVIREATSTVVGTSSSSMWGGEINARGICLKIGGFTFGTLGGFRYVNFNEDLNVVNNVVLTRPSNPNLQTISDTDVNPPIPARLDFTTFDIIRTHNNFYSGQIGADMKFDCGRFFLFTRGKAAVGLMDQSVSINSFTNNNGVTTPGGLLASPLDNGVHSRDRIAFLTQGEVKLGYNFTSWLKGFVGYDVIYINQIARPANETATSTLNTNISVGGTQTAINVNQPTFRFRDTSLLTQGLSFGLELQF